MAKGKASLAELMGSSGANGGLKLSRLRDVLGDAMPEMPRNAVGRHRLLSALQQRFGDGFRSIPGVRGLLGEFDSEVAHHGRMAQLRQIKYSPPKKGK